MLGVTLVPNTEYRIKPQKIYVSIIITYVQTTDFASFFGSLVFEIIFGNTTLGPVAAKEIVPKILKILRAEKASVFKNTFAFMSMSNRAIIESMKTDIIARNVVETAKNVVPFMSLKTPTYIRGVHATIIIVVHNRISLYPVQLGISIILRSIVADNNKYAIAAEPKLIYNVSTTTFRKYTPNASSANSGYGSRIALFC